MAKEIGKRAIGYVRVSTDGQEHGVKAQRDALESWAERNGVHVSRVELDLGVSGGAPLDRRPGLLSAIDAIREESAGILLVAKRDRLARDVVVAAMVERLVAREGARIESADGAGNGDAADPGVLLLRRMVDVFAEYERAICRARVKAALAAKRRRGERIGKVPYGYRLGVDGVRLVADGGEQEIVTLAKELRAKGLSYRRIGAELEAAGLSTRGGGAWFPATVRKIVLAEPVGGVRE